MTDEFFKKTKKRFPDAVMFNIELDYVHSKNYNQNQVDMICKLFNSGPISVDVYGCHIDMIISRKLDLSQYKKGAKVSVRGNPEVIGTITSDEPLWCVYDKCVRLSQHNDEIIEELYRIDDLKYYRLTKAA